MTGGVIVAGGELDPAIPWMDVYLATPAAAEAPPTRACRAARAYIERINAGRFADVPELFDEAGVLMEPSGRTLRGIEAIRGFYEGSIGAMRPQIVAVSYVGDETDCMVELATLKPVGGEPRWVLVSVDHFTLAANGKVARMVAFARAPRPVTSPGR